MAVKFVKSWERIQGQLKNGKDWLLSPAQESLMWLGFEMRRDVQANMYAHPPPALSDWSQKSKKKKNLGSGTWVASGWMAASGMAQPKVMPIGSGQFKLELLVTDADHPSGFPATELFGALEYGTKSKAFAGQIPARPVLTPIYDMVDAGTYPKQLAMQQMYIDKVRASL